VPELEKKLFDKLEIDLNNEQKDLKSILENLEQKIWKGKHTMKNYYQKKNSMKSR